KRGPVAVAVDPLVRDRALDHEYVGCAELAARGPAERREVVLAAERVGEHLVVQVHLRDSRYEPEHHILEAGLRGGGEREGVAVAAHAFGDPQIVQLVDRRRRGGHGFLLEHIRGSGSANGKSSTRRPRTGVRSSTTPG